MYFVNSKKLITFFIDHNIRDNEKGVMEVVFEWYNINLFLFIRMQKKVTIEDIKKQFPLAGKNDLEKLIILGKIVYEDKYYMAS